MLSISRNFAGDIIECFERGNKILVCGNGGSAAESQHWVAELVGHFVKKRKALPAIALTTDTSILTSIGNDDDYKYVFSRQIEALGKPGDILFILSTSGKSKNCVEAEKTAINMAIKIRIFPIKAGGQSTAYVQEKHLRIIHEICTIVDNFYAENI
jgi:D-sedoheptulose 7-phosphate isomerase